MKVFSITGGIFVTACLYVVIRFMRAVALIGARERVLEIRHLWKVAITFWRVADQSLAPLTPSRSMPIPISITSLLERVEKSALKGMGQTPLEWMNKGVSVELLLRRPVLEPLTSTNQSPIRHSQYKEESVPATAEPSIFWVA